MRDRVEALIAAVLDEADAIDDLIDVVREQREAMRSEGAEVLQDLMRELREIFFDVQALEGVRDRMARELALDLGCEPRASSLSDAFEEDERALFNGAADRLSQSVFGLKSEMVILSGLIDQNERFTSMILSEWRRIEGGLPRPTGAEFRG
ncbi:MAG: flagellar export chaperone FlgN [Fretibacterium sp.]|nr:flagellar export chaperone FlgN [Fretibacterium sp.]